MGVVMKRDDINYKLQKEAVSKMMEENQNFDP